MVKRKDGNSIVFCVMFLAGKMGHRESCRHLFNTFTSGDGTLRKNEGIWNDWRPSNALGLHR